MKRVLAAETLDERVLAILGRTLHAEKRHHGPIQSREATPCGSPRPSAPADESDLARAVLGAEQHLPKFILEDADEVSRVLEEIFDGCHTEPARLEAALLAQRPWHVRGMRWSALFWLHRNGRVSLTRLIGRMDEADARDITAQLACIWTHGSRADFDDSVSLLLHDAHAASACPASADTPPKCAMSAAVLQRLIDLGGGMEPRRSGLQMLARMAELGNRLRDPSEHADGRAELRASAGPSFASFLLPRIARTILRRPSALADSHASAWVADRPTAAHAPDCVCEQCMLRQLSEMTVRSNGAAEAKVYLVVTQWVVIAYWLLRGCRGRPDQAHSEHIRRYAHISHY